ncbi:MAG: hypothetical protein FWG71_05525 [Synergistaceae bacterium]|nr:hypothetical protein [Synergistaceae bacterium]
MKKVLFAFAFVFFASPAVAALSVDYFIPPVQVSDEAERAEARSVKEPGEVREVTGEVTGKPAISAKSAQDALNHWADKRVEGFTEVLFPQGFGFVSTGIGTYEVHPNPVATRISKRNAYTLAYMQAKRQLAEGLNGVLSEGNTKAFEQIAMINESMGQTLANVESVTTEAIAQRVNGFLRGFVVYDIFDDVDASRVYLTIVTTPRTQEQFDRSSTSSISAVSMQEGLAQVFAEIENGLVAPVGGKTVFVPATGEIAFVGFGSAVIGRQDDRAVQARIELAAERIARVRARDALCGIILGEDIQSTESVDSQLISMTETFDVLTSDDPAVTDNPDHPGYVKLQERRASFMSAEVYQSEIQSVRGGVLPPGVRHQSWMDEDKAFAYAVSIFMPSASSGPAHSGTQTPQEEIKQGPSGRVQGIDGL